MGRSGMYRLSCYLVVVLLIMIRHIAVVSLIGSRLVEVLSRLVLLVAEGPHLSISLIIARLLVPVAAGFASILICIVALLLLMLVAPEIWVAAVRGSPTVMP